jgi:thioredoxin reductase (NADPH)
LVELVANDQELSNIILRAFLARREILIDIGAGVKLVGSRYSRCTHRLREFLIRNRAPFQWMDLEDDEEADALLRALRIDAAETPVVISGEGVLRNPSNAAVAQLLEFGADRTWAFRRGSRAASSPNGPRYRPGGSAPAWWCRRRPSA